MSNKSSLEESMEAFLIDPTQKIYNEVLLAIVNDARNGKHINVPISINKDENGEILMEYGMVQGTDGRYYYVICTDAKELDGLGYESSAVMKIYDLMKRASNDSEMGGICINPWSAKNCIITNEYVEMLLRIINSDEDI